MEKNNLQNKNMNKKKNLSSIQNYFAALPIPETMQQSFVTSVFSRREFRLTFSSGVTTWREAASLTLSAKFDRRFMGLQSHLRLCSGLPSASTCSSVGRDAFLRCFPKSRFESATCSFDLCNVW